MAKLAKSAVDFEHPAQGPNHCGECWHFMPPDECRIVMGRVTARDWCKRFDAKRGSREAARRRHLGDIAGPTG